MMTGSHKYSRAARNLGKFSTALIWYVPQGLETNMSVISCIKIGLKIGELRTTVKV